MNKKSFILALTFLLIITKISFSQEDTINTAYVSAGEIMHSLKKAGTVTWSKVITYPTTANYTHKYTKSLNLGVRVADGLVAIYDKDITNYSKINDQIFSLADGLGFASYITSQKESISKSIAKSDFDAIASDVNYSTSVLIDQIKTDGYDDYMALIYVGGYVEGIRIVSEYLKTNYNATTAANLMGNIEVVDQFIQLLNKSKKIHKDLGTNAMVISVAKTLDDIKAAIKADNKMSLETVKKINLLCTTSVALIIKG